MDKSLNTLLIFSAFMISLFVSSSAQTCSSYTFSSNRLYTTCTDLPYLGAFLHWTYHPSNHTVDIAYRHTGVDSSWWVAWALNLDRPGMLGSQSLVALRNTSSGAARAYTSAVSGYGTSLEETTLSFEVKSIAAEYSGRVMIIYATLVLPTGRTRFNQLWQVGPVSRGRPLMHAVSGDNLRSIGIVDFVTGRT